jgi:hypothetical protein
VCLGVRFSQVEFVAVVACLLSEKRLVIVPKARESREDTIKRVRDFQLLLRMKRPEEIRLCCSVAE